MWGQSSLHQQIGGSHSIKWIYQLEKGCSHLCMHSCWPWCQWQDRAQRLCWVWAWAGSLGVPWQVALILRVQGLWWLEISCTYWAKAGSNSSAYMQSVSNLISYDIKMNFLCGGLGMNWNIRDFNCNTWKAS